MIANKIGMSSDQLRQICEESAEVRQRIEKGDDIDLNILERDLKIEAIGEQVSSKYTPSSD